MSQGPRRPPPTRDLDTPEEIAEMVRRFYQDVAQDDLLGPMFNDIARVDWSEHLPKLTAFWCRALLGIEGYVGNPYRAHSLINGQAPFTAAHFERWLDLFHDAVELGWTGPNAERALALAHNVARVHAGQLIGHTDDSGPAQTDAPLIAGPIMSPDHDGGTPGQVDDQDRGGDPPCWEGRIVDHRDAPRTPPVPPDLSTPTQIHHLVTIFYREIVFDELLEPVFSDVAEVDWVEHIPKLIDYWCWILLGTAGYPGAVTRTHRHLHETKAIEPAHCDRWFKLWVGCVDERWAGPHADHAKSHAATLMTGMAKRIFGFAWQAPADTLQPTPDRT